MGLDQAYLSGPGACFESHYADAEARARSLRRARPIAPAVLGAIRAQNAKLPSSAARDRALDVLERGARAVVTGQQVGLFLGPLYTLYKAATAISAARSLTAEHGVPVVPIFWLQAEDHDLEEIAECSVPSAEGPITIRIPIDRASRVAIAHLTLPDALTACLADLEQAIGHLPCAKPHLAMVSRHYRPGVRWADAFSGLLSEIFGELLFVDPRDPSLARISAPIHEAALTDAGPIGAALMERVRALRSRGFDPPVHVREGSPLSFFHPEGPLGPRYRLEPVQGGFQEVGGARSHTLEALLRALASDPLSFSTSALLRPIVQDSLLPTAAYVGGPTEVAYYAQLAPLYAHYELEMPLIVPRARFRLIDHRTARRLDRLGIAPSDAERPEQEIFASLQPASADPEALAHTLFDSFDSALREAAPAISAAGEAKAVERTRDSVERSVKKLAGRYRRALLRRDRALVESVRRVVQMIHPKGAPQERVYSPSWYAAHTADLAEKVLAAIAPFDPRVRDLFP